MKKLEMLRFSVQSLFLILTVAALFVASTPLKWFFLGAALLSGAFYCGWACPFGFLQDVASRLGTALKIKKRQVPESFHNMAVYFRYILAALVLYASSDALFTLLGYEPRGTFIGFISGNGASTAALISVVLFFVVSMFYERAFCRYLCIEGAKYGLLSFLRIVTVRRNPNSCVNCKKCDKACPMQISVSKTTNLRSPQCISCMKCVGACPIKNTLSYGVAHPIKISEQKPERKIEKSA